MSSVRIPGMPKRLDDAIDDYLAELARRGRQPSTRQRYRETLNKFAVLYEDRALRDLRPEDCRRFIDRWTNLEPSTLAHGITVLRGFFGFLEDEGNIRRSPMARIQRPPVKRSEDLHVVTVSERDVERLLAVCESWPELLCIVVLIYMGPRLTAAAHARRSDLDFDRGTVRFREKGRKIAVKPVPDDALAIFAAAEDQDVWPSLDSYLIPAIRKPRRDPRDPKAIYYRVAQIAKRARVKTHVHSLRAAFAVQYIEQHEGDLEGLQLLMGHSNPATTRIYLRRQDKQRAMERVRDLKWGGMLPSIPVTDSVSSEYSFSPKGLPEPLERKLAELSQQARVARKARR